MTHLSDIRSELKAALWQFEQRDPPARLAHYSSLDALVAILRSQELWFSNPLYMNDWEELRFGMREGAEAFQTSDALRTACGEKHDELRDVFASMLSTFETEHALEVFILCLSEHEEGDTDGQLSMWRGYGERGQGAALLLDTSQFSRYQSLPLITLPVEYLSTEERQARLKQLAASAAEVAARHPRTSENLLQVAHVFLERLKLFSVLAKHPGFKEEREWRIVYFREHDTDGRLTHPIGYQLTKRGIEPKLKLSHQHAVGNVDPAPSPEELVAGILLGPSLSSELSQASFRRMLRLEGLTSLADRVTASRIPFRAF